MPKENSNQQPIQKNLPIDDMRDGEDIRKLEYPLSLVISYIHTSLYETYTEYDRDAIDKQKYHRAFSALAVFFGTLAILLSILQVYLRAYDNPASILNNLDLAIFEKGAFLTALIAIGIALGSRLLRDWLKKRYMAEQCRTLKFRALIHPYLSFSSEDSWTEQFKTWKARFNREIASLKEREQLTLEDILLSDKVNPPPHDTSDSPLNIPYLMILMDYYREKRITTQLKYFSFRARSFRTANKNTERIPQYCFIGGVVCAGVQYGIELFNPGSMALFTPQANLNVLFLGTLFSALIVPFAGGVVFAGLLAEIMLVGFLVSSIGSETNLIGFQAVILLITLVLPSVGVAFRTWRSSIEVSRNASLFSAKCMALRQFDLRLAAERAKENIDWEEILKIIWECENFFENENKEWLRIMHDAEWFL